MNKDSRGAKPPQNPELNEAERYRLYLHLGFKAKGPVREPCLWQG